jgi:hypothetical protein
MRDRYGKKADPRSIKRNDGYQKPNIIAGSRKQMNLSKQGLLMKTLFPKGVKKVFKA